MFAFFYSFALLVLASSVFAAPSAPKTALVNLRIEGADSTIFESDLIVGYGNVTTPSGGNHICNGLNLEANPTAGPTCTYALQEAAKLAHFQFDGTFDTEFDDFFITSIGDSTETATEFWGLLVNYQFTPVGGCQQEVKTGDKVLWAFDAFNAVHFLELSGPILVAKGKPTKYTVVDGSTNSAVSGATVYGNTTVDDGTVYVTFKKIGLYTLKATAPGSIRSNAVEVLVI